MNKRKEDDLLSLVVSNDCFFPLNTENVPTSDRSCVRMAVKDVKEFMTATSHLWKLLHSKVGTKMYVWLHAA